MINLEKELEKLGRARTCNSGLISPVVPQSGLETIDGRTVIRVELGFVASETCRDVFVSKMRSFGFIDDDLSVCGMSIATIVSKLEIEQRLFLKQVNEAVDDWSRDTDVNTSRVRQQRQAKRSPFETIGTGWRHRPTTW